MQKTMLAITLVALALAAGCGARDGGGRKGAGVLNPMGPDDQPIVIAADAANTPTSDKAPPNADPYIRGAKKDSHNHNFPWVEADGAGGGYFELAGYTPTCIVDNSGTEYDLSSGSTVVGTLSNGDTITISFASLPNVADVKVVPKSAADLNVNPPDYIQVKDPKTTWMFYASGSGAGDSLTAPINLRSPNAIGTKSSCPKAR